MATRRAVDSLLPVGDTPKMHATATGAPSTALKDNDDAESAAGARRTAPKGSRRAKLDQKERRSRRTEVHATATLAPSTASKTTTARRAQPVRGARRQKARDELNSIRKSGDRGAPKCTRPRRGAPSAASLKTTTARRAQPLRGARRRRARDELSSI